MSKTSVTAQDIADLHLSNRELAEVIAAIGLDGVCEAIQTMTLPPNCIGENLLSSLPDGVWKRLRDDGLL